MSRPATEGDKPVAESTPRTGFNDKYPKYILVLGPPGCGTSSFIKMAMGYGQSIPSPKLPGTTFSCLSCKINDQHIHFIDTPGLGDPATALNMLVDLVGYLKNDPSSSQPLPIRLNGIIYIHPESSSDIPALRRNLRMLKALIGSSQLDYLTFLIRPQNEKCQDGHVQRSLKVPSSPFSTFFTTHHPTIVVSESNDGRESVKDLETLVPYLSSRGAPRRLYIQQKVLDENWTKTGVTDFLQEIINNTRDDTEPPQTSKIKDSVFPWQKAAQKTGDTALPSPVHGKSQGDKELHTDTLSVEKRTEQNITTNEEAESELGHKEELEKLKLEHAKLQEEHTSLYTHLQITDNIAEDQVTQKFDRINRLIGELGYCISEDLSAHQPGTIIQIGQLDPLQFQKLAKIFGHAEGSTSLLKSSNNEYPSIADFIDYAIRGVLCGQLYESLFEPFHPSLASPDRRSQNDFLVTVYQQIARREPQSVTGRWRRDTFNSISSSNDQESTPPTLQAITSTTRNFLDIISQSSADELLTEEHKKLLGKLATEADEWNQLVKCKVVFGGEFHPIAHHHRCTFQPDIMCKHGAKPHDTNHPDFGLAVVELGLIKRYAIGEDNEPEKTILRRMSVVHEKLLF